MSAVTTTTQVKITARVKIVLEEPDALDTAGDRYRPRAGAKPAPREHRPARIREIGLGFEWTHRFDGWTWAFQWYDGYALIEQQRADGTWGELVQRTLFDRRTPEVEALIERHVPVWTPRVLGLPETEQETW